MAAFAFFERRLRVDTEHPRPPAEPEKNPPANTGGLSHPTYAARQRAGFSVRFM